MASVVSATTGASALIENGVITNQITPEERAEKERQDKATNNPATQKDQFLQLLVAQMKYQDPLEPTSNTEYISQYATFSSLEQMQNMSATMTMSRANEMVGKQVVIHHKENGAGATQEIEGVVDYVTYENSKAKVFVNGSAYEVDEVYAVLGDAYQASSQLAEEFTSAVNKLPNLYEFAKTDASKVENLANTYDKLDNTTKSLIQPEIVDKLMKYVTRMTEAGWVGARKEEASAVQASDKQKTEVENTTAQEQASGASEAQKQETKETEETDTEEEEGIIPADQPMDA